MLTATAGLSEENMPDLSDRDVSKYNTSSCKQDWNNPKAKAVARSGTMTAHVAYLCFGKKQIGKVVLWVGQGSTKEKPAWVLSSLAGAPNQKAKSQNRKGSDAYTIHFKTKSSRKVGATCQLFKPAGGIAPQSLAICRK